MSARSDGDLLPEIEPIVRAQSLVTAVAEQIEGLIREGHLRNGDQLPTEGTLGRRLGVSRTVVREALARLSARRLVEVRGGAGGGIFVRGPSVELVSDSLRMLFQPEADTAHHQRTLEVRRLLEVEIASLAALRRTDADLARLDAVQAENEAARHDRERFAELDVAFHRALAVATQNEMFVLLMDALGGVLLPLRRLGYSTPGNPDRAFHYHQRILDEVRAGDSEAARHAMRAHLDEAEDTLRMALALQGQQAHAQAAHASPQLHNMNDSI